MKKIGIYLFIVMLFGSCSEPFLPEKGEDFFM